MGNSASATIEQEHFIPCRCSSRTAALGSPDRRGRRAHGYSDGDARVFSTGQNGSGQLRETSNRSAFIAASSAERQVGPQSSGRQYLHDGLVGGRHLSACGGNDGGQLGLGDTTDRDTLTAVRALPGGEIPKQVAAGVQHTVILTLSGAIFGSGVNQHGQAGLPPFEPMAPTWSTT